MNPERIRRRLRRAMVPVYDIVMAGVSLPLAFAMRVGTEDVSRYASFITTAVPIFCALTAVVFLGFGIYRQVVRYTSFRDFATILNATAVLFILFAPAYFLIASEPVLPRSVPLIHAFCFGVLVVAPRYLRRAVHEARMTRPETAEGSHPPMPILLVGCGENATLLIRALARRRAAPFRILGIIDLAEHKVGVGRDVLGVPVVATVASLPRLLASVAGSEGAPRKAVLTEAVTPQTFMALQQAAAAAGVSLARLPDLTRFRDASGDEQFELQPVAFEDLMTRPLIPLDEAAIDHLIEGQRVLVTGAGGSIGAELCRQIARRRPANLMLLDLCEYNLYAIDMELGSRFPDVPRTPLLLDVRDGARISATFASLKPDIVFHAAALKHVPLVEMNPIEGLRTNVFGTRNVAVAAQQAGAAAFVQISTDKAVNPTNVMGASKRLAERVCQALDLASDGNGAHRTRFLTVRFGNVFGSSGSVVPLFQTQVRRGGPVTVTHPNMTRFFMRISEAAGLVLHASAHALEGRAERGQVFVLDMGEPVRILDLAEQIIRLAGLEPYRDVPITFIGLRPGEKLYEELFDDGEHSLPSGMPGVLSARSKTITVAEINQALAMLQFACDQGDAAAAVTQLARCVPGYAAPAAPAAADDSSYIPAAAAFASHGRNGERQRLPLGGFGTAAATDRVAS